MSLSILDWVIVGLYFFFVLITGLVVSRRGNSTTSDFFLSGRDMPWWLLGVSMVATTFSADTPNLVTDLVRNNGVSGNWTWWAFLITGMLTVFVFARLWRRSMVMTDVEFYEIRYSGQAAAFLRGFRALYLGLIFNVLVMGAVSLAAIKFGEIVLGLDGWVTLLIAGSITLIYSTMGGLKAVIITDFVQFILAMIGSVWASIYILGLEEVGGLSNMLAHANVAGKTSILPSFDDPNVWVPVLLIPLAVQWWASYYPGSEPGGGGYIAQRMFSAKNEKHAIGATLLYNVAHYALRPWPWILIALASLIVFPDLDSITRVFPDLSKDKIGHDVAYPAMLTLLPSGLLGLVAASLIAAFMSTMSTQLNLGASYLVNDLYLRFINPEASQKRQVQAAQIFTVITAFLGLGLGLLLTSASQAFELLLLLGAGTGLIYILRWFWWRINAWTEIVAMMASLMIAYYFNFQNDTLEAWEKICYGALITTFVWVVSTYLTPPTDQKTLREFYQKISPGGRGWDFVISQAAKEGIELKKPNDYLGLELLCVVLGITTVFATLFATGAFLYSNYVQGLVMTVTSILGVGLLIWAWGQMNKGESSNKGHNTSK